MKFALAAGVTLGGSQSAQADSLRELLEQGYQVEWEGYASITTCVHDQNTYKLGSYLFVCDQYTYEYPYHYGDTVLVARALTHKGETLLLSYLCLVSGDDEGDCIPGSIYHQ